MRKIDPTRSLSMFCMCAMLVTPVAAAESLNIDRQGLAVEGYDTVAYHLAGAAQQGSEAHAVDWQGGRWLFATDENRKAFLEDPQRFAPRYGGYCAYAMSKGKLADIDPQAWTLVEGVLYLNYSPKIRKTWLEDRDERIEAADNHWERIVNSDGR